MKELVLFTSIAVLLGCREDPPQAALVRRERFVQGDISILPPVETLGNAPAMEDGGTTKTVVRDATGKEFHIYVDRRIGTKTRNGIYLNTYPGTSNSVHIIREDEFRKKIIAPY